MTKISRRILTLILGAIAFLSLAFGVSLTLPQTKTAKAADATDLVSTARMAECGIGGYSDTPLYRILLTESDTATWDFTSFCANEYGGEVLKWIKINGKSIYEHRTEYQAAVTAGERSPVTSGQSNINDNQTATNIYAPIFVNVLYHSSLSAKAIDMYIPNSYMTRDEITSIEITTDFNSDYINTTKSTTATVSYVLSKNVYWSIGGGIRTTKYEGGKPAYTATTTTVTAPVTPANENANFFSTKLGVSDYAETGENDVDNSVDVRTAVDALNFWNYVYLDGVSLNKLISDLNNSNVPSEVGFNVWGSSPSFSFRISTFTAEYMNNLTEIKYLKGCQFPSYGNLTTACYELAEDVTFFKYNGEWVSTATHKRAKDVTFSGGYISGAQSELVKFEISIADFAWTEDDRDAFDWNYDAGVPLRQSIKINGTSIYDIQTTVDDGSYVYSTSPMSNDGGQNATFSHPIILRGNITTTGNKMELWVHKDYLATLGDEVTITLSSGAQNWTKDSTLTEDASQVYYKCADGSYATTKMEETATEVTEVSTTKHGYNFITFTLSNLDFPADVEGLKIINNTESAKYSKVNFMSYIYVNGKPLSESQIGEVIYNLAGTNTISIRLIDYGQEGDANFDNKVFTAAINKIEIKAGCQFPAYSYAYEGGAIKSYATTEDTVWMKIDGAWTSVFDASEMQIGELYVGGSANELYKVDITFPKAYKFDCNNYDFMYDGYIAYRQNIYVNGVSIYDINANTDDSGYTYSTGPMNGNDEIFAKPIIIETYTGNYNSNEQATNAAPTNLMTLWIHKNYIESLGAGDITVKIGAGFIFTGGTTEVAYDWGKPLGADASAVVSTKYTVTVDGERQLVLKGACAVEPTVVSGVDNGTLYIFDEWQCNGETFDFSTPITSDMTITAVYTTQTIKETTVTNVRYQDSYDDDWWLIFNLSNHDYSVPVKNGDSIDNQNVQIYYTELLRIGFYDHITLKGKIYLHSSDYVEEITLAELYDKLNDYGDGPYMNIWADWGALGVRIIGGYKNGDVHVRSEINEVVIEEGCCFPSWSSSTSTYVYGVTETITYAASGTTKSTTENGTFTYNVYSIEPEFDLDIRMKDGAAVRVSGSTSTSGIRFQTYVSVDTVNALSGYDVEYGTLIVPTDYLMGGQFTHEWLSANGKEYLDIVKAVNGQYQWANQGTTVTIDGVAYYTYMGSIVEIKDGNLSRNFSGIGYIKITQGEKVTYVYADYDATNSRSASYVANAAINDRGAQSDTYKYDTGNNDYSPYSDRARDFLQDTYVQWSNSHIEAKDLDGLATKDSSVTIDVNQKLTGAYVQLVYSTNVNVTGVFTYTDGNKTANEDFYLQAGTTVHKQFLDLFRYNGVGYGMDVSNLTMTSITLKNAELSNGKTTGGSVKVYGLYSENKTLNTNSQEVYVTVGDMTVGAHLGLGGSLTYLAKAGLYEGIKSGNVVLSNSNIGYDDNDCYGSASSTADSGAVNLINNFDAGRQIQQSWYAAVGGTDGAVANGYQRTYCYTGSKEGEYWPYNPVQAGDIVSNPGQIIDYEVNETKGYIYVKARAMDWAKGAVDVEKASESGAVKGGVTTKSYMENYYRLVEDGKGNTLLYVNNAFVDWNGFTDMESCGTTPVELPATYPIQSLNYYVSNVGVKAWQGVDNLSYYNNLTSWTGGTAFYQRNNDPSISNKMVEYWYAWANGDTKDAIGLGMYIPNVSGFTSGRSLTSTAKENSANSNALTENILSDKGLMSNMQKIGKEYQGAYVSNTSYTAPGVSYRMVAYTPIEYTYVLSVNTIETIYTQFKDIYDKGAVTNAGREGYHEKVGLDAWARSDKAWTF